MPRKQEDTKGLADVFVLVCPSVQNRCRFHKRAGGAATPGVLIGVLTIGLALGSLLMDPGARAASPTRIVFVAHVDNVYDPGEALGGGIGVDDLLRGTITYDADMANTDPRPDVGRYSHHQAPFGISIEGGPFIFQTDPTRVDFSIVVSNDRGVPPRDSYVVTSSNNLPLQNGASVSRISWELVDETHRALSSAALPSTPPDLDKWQSEFGLTIEGRSTVEFIIRAHVVEAKPCTPGIRCPSPQ